MDLKKIVKRLEEYASLDTAVDWDNVGLLIEPTDARPVKKVLVTNDLTEPVMNEAIAKGVELIVSYHPAIFKPLKRLTQTEWNQRKMIRCLENRIAVYSPHTTWDSIEFGSNYWLLQAFDTKRIESIEGQEIKSKKDPSGFSKNIKVNLSFGPSKDRLLSKLQTYPETIRFLSEREVYGAESMKQLEIEVLASSQGVVDFIETLNSIYPEKENVLSTLRIHEMDKPWMKTVGLGRIGYLNEPITIRQVVDKMKAHLKMKTFRIALGNGKTLDDKVERIAVGAGYGNGVLKDIKADMFITGEVTHHEILREVHRGVSFIVTDHSDTERGYGYVFRERFLDLLKKNNDPQVEIIISEKDRDPLEYI